MTSLLVGCKEKEECSDITAISTTCESSMSDWDSLTINPISNNKVNCCFSYAVLSDGKYIINETCIGGEKTYTNIKRFWNGDYCQYIED